MIFLKQLLLFYLFVYQVKTIKVSLDILVVSVATESNDGFKRFKASVEYFDLPLLVLGMNQTWRGGDLVTGTGGAQKINLLKQGLASYKDRENLIVFFTDSYDVIFTGGKEEIIQKFKSFNTNLIFSAETTIWPDASLKDQYPKVKEGKRFLCSGGIIGYIKEFWSAINSWNVNDDDDDQLFYTKIYLNSESRKLLNATLDHKSQLVQNINFAKNELEMFEKEDVTRIRNTKYNTIPVAIHGNGPTKIHLNHYGNYIPVGWHSNHGCRKCDKDLFNLDKIAEHDFPTVQISIFVEESVPFFMEFLEKIEAIVYPKSKITLFVHNNDAHAERLLSQFLLHHRNKYVKVHVIPPHEYVDEATARKMAGDICVLENCDYQFSIDGNVQVSNTQILKHLISKNKQVVAPVVKRDGKLWSNFWGALNLDGFYARSDDYLSIVNGEKRGIWNMPFINQIYLVKGETVKFLHNKIPQPFLNNELDPDMAFCNYLRYHGIFMYVTNEQTFGRLLMTENVHTNKLHPDLWQIQENKLDWEEKYIHSGFWNNTLEGVPVENPCPDAYMFPLFTEKMCNDIVETVEDFGEWSNGKNEDTRLAGGYENVPTVDIHMNQVGYENEWLHMLSTYVNLVVQKVYPGYYSKAISHMMFVVRYKPSEQSFLRPHHDSSTWTMNVALNSPDEYEGGGCRFLRYDCSVTSIPKGYAMIHPGRLTHYHEGLQTTKGTRYIAVSFVDP